MADYQGILAKADPKIIQIIRETASEYGIPHEMALGLAYQESGFNPNAVSPTNVEGLFQVTNETGSKYGQTPQTRRDPKVSARAGLAYLKDVLKQTDGNWEMALNIYNSGSAVNTGLGGNKNFARDVMMASAAYGGSGAPVIPVQAEAPVVDFEHRRQVASRDPRESIINEGLRVTGRTRSSLGDDPKTLDAFYGSTLKLALQTNPKLDMRGGMPAFLGELQKIPSPTPQGAPGELNNDGSTNPPAPPEKSTTGRVVADLTTAFTTPQGLADMGVQTVRGLVIDPAVGFIKTVEDLTTIANSRMPLPKNWMSDVGGLNISGAGPVTGADPGDNLGAAPKMGETVQQYVDRLVGAPKTGTSSTVRAMVGFLAPFLAMLKPIKAMTGLGAMTGALAAEAVTNAVFVDPDNPNIVDMIDTFARGLAPNDPNTVRSQVTQYINGFIDDDALAKSLAGRGLNVVANAPVSVAADILGKAVMSVFRGLRGSREAKRLVAQEQALQAKHGPFDQPVPENRGTAGSLKVNPEEVQGDLFGGVSPPQAQPPMVQGELFTPEVRTATYQTKRAADIARNLEANPDNPAFQADARAWLQSTQGTTDQTIAQARAEVITRMNEAGAAVPGGPKPQAPPAQTPPSSAPVPETATPGKTPPAESLPLTEKIADLYTSGVPVPQIVRQLASEFPEQMGARTRANFVRDTITRYGDAPKVPEIPAPVVKAATVALSNLDETVAQVAKGIEPPILPPVSKTLDPAATVEQFTLEGTLVEAQGIFDLAAKPISETGLSQETKTFLGLLKARLTDETTRNLGLSAILKGGLSGLLAEAALEPIMAEAADGEGSVDRNVRRLAVFLAAAGLGLAGFKPTVAAIRQLMAQADQIKTKSLRDVKVTTPKTRPPGSPLVETEAQVLAKGSAGPGSTFVGEGANRKAIHFDAVEAPGDLRKLVTDLEQSFPNAASLPAKYKPIPLGDTYEMAARFAEDPEALLELAKQAQDPGFFSRRAAALIVGAEAAASKAQELAQVASRGNGEAATEALRLFSIAGELAKGFFMGKSDFGRALNVFRQASDGRIMQLMVDGEMAGQLKGTTMNTDQFIDWLSKMDPAGIVKAGRQATEPTFGGALNEVFYNAMLSAPITGGRVLGSNIMMIGLNAFERSAGAALSRLTRAYQPGDPLVREGLDMMVELGQQFTNMLRLGVKTAVTGDTSFVEHGSQGAFAPQFVRQAFPDVLTKVPGVGATIDFLGTAGRVVGSRKLLVADEMGHYAIEQMEKRAWAVRLAEQKLGPEVSLADRATFIERTMDNLPPEAISEIKRQKNVLTMMNTLFDDRDGFRMFRAMANNAQQWAAKFPPLRVMLPFIRSMSNLLLEGLERTPALNLTSPTMWRNLQSTDPVIRNSAFGKVASSLGFMTVGGGMAMTGHLTGALTNDPQVRRELASASIHENSIRIPGTNKWMALDPSGPLGFPLIAMADMASVARDDMFPGELGAGANLLSSMYDLFANQYFLGVLGHFFETYKDSRVLSQIERDGIGGVAGKTLDDVLVRGKLPPRIVEEFTKIIDPYKKVHEGLMANIQNRTVGGGIRETDILGDPRYVGGGYGEDTTNNVLRYLFPLVPSVPRDDKLRVDLAAKGVFLRDPRALFSRNGVDVPLTKPEMQRLRELMARPERGPSLRESLTRVTQHPLWARLSSGEDGQAETVVQQQVQRYAEQARLRLLRESPALRQRLEDRARELELVPAARPQ